MEMTIPSYDNNF